MIVSALAFTLISNQIGQTKRDPIIKVETGFVRATFMSAKGNVTVILPDDITPGDTISGTVFPDNKEFDMSKLQVDIGDAHGIAPDPTSPRRTWTIPKTSEVRLSLTAWTTDGVSLGTTYVSIGQPKTKPTGYTIPSFARTGSPFVVKGPYDGEAANTVVNIGDKPVPVVAESPRQAVALAPSSLLPGESPLEVQESGLHAKAQVRFLLVSVSTPKTNLLKGEKTQLTINVQGIQDLETATTPMIVVENLTPKTIDLDGKAKHFLFAKPSPEGDYSHTFVVTSILAGSFSVSAVVDPGAGTKVDPSKLAGHHCRDGDLCDQQQQ